MGYTHYWKQPRLPPTLKEWEKFRIISECIVQEARRQGISILGRSGKNDKPEFTNDVVAFNGNDDLSHETFLIERNPSDFSFCKTARKPYDAAVVACLLAAERYLPNFEWSSDGEGEEGYKDAGQQLIDIISPLWRQP